jgi:light-regulated signal transduction histidine kinase (bacteriophytochrome)
VDIVMMLGGIAEDVTASKERDEAQRQVTSKLEQLVADRTKELEQANAELDAFSRTAAHDLKNPLNGIQRLEVHVRQRWRAHHRIGRAPGRSHPHFGR